MQPSPGTRSFLEDDDGQALQPRLDVLLLDHEVGP